MKTIKFRAWDGQNIYPVESIHFDIRVLDVRTPCNTIACEGHLFEYSFDEVELMQYTGVRDKNNKEIYEGDIVMVTNMMVETIPPYSAVVEWDKYRFTIRNLDINDNKFNMIAHGAFGFTPFRDLDPFGLSLEVIGNKYENPELIKS